MKKRPTIYDVAERAGVSKSLVSLVLRDSPRVSDAKREAVLEAVTALNYTPSRLAAGLAGTRTRSVGVIIDDFSNLWFVEALAGLRTALAEGGYALSVADASLNAHLGIDPIEAFRALRVDGIVLAGEASAPAVARSGVPAVVLGVRDLGAELAELPVIASDEAAGGRLATMHLAVQGHRDIACVSAPGASAARRERGYCDAIAELGLTPTVVRAPDTGEAAAREVAAELLARAESAQAPRPTAVFAVNDPMAVGVIGAARELGIAVPGDLSVVGYDDSPIAAYGLVSLTSVSGDPRELGEAAGQVLIAKLEGGATQIASRSFTPRLVARGSVAAY
ncbi:DNA-binding LacI/PurR family transcriptional regulator [Leucobacter exalbidus]|uniref:DNA-binding LacI/PurR family transcriptional regulator n=1 Tax=Leucobacter exalbidus TaxID=662960 RepID=A0A940PNM3_9MICO|nr:DNA-binding LacI/PurR family transcriptional regulator [Leucobacter exalbidus]